MTGTGDSNFGVSLEGSSLGQALRQARMRRGYTLQDLSRRTGLSVSSLSNVERDLSSPTVSTLRRILNGLGMSMVDLFRTLENTAEVVRKDQRVELLRSPDGKIRYELVSPAGSQRLEVMLLYLEPGASSGPDPHVHPGEEVGLVLRGRLRYWVGDKVFDLEAGDAIYHDAKVPHRYENIAEEICISVWAVSPTS